MDNAITSIIAWAAQIASAVIVTALTAQIKSRQDAAERKRDEAQAETEAKRKAEAEWCSYCLLEHRAYYRYVLYNSLHLSPCLEG